MSGGVRVYVVVLAACVLAVLVLTGLASSQIPPDPVGISNTTGNFWVNHTWSAGTSVIFPDGGVDVSGSSGASGTGTTYNNGRKLARASDGTLWVVYRGLTTGSMYLVNSTDEGVTWNMPLLVTVSASGQMNPSIAIDSSDVVHIVWTGAGWGANPVRYNIQYRNRTASGWGTQEAVTDSASYQYAPSIAVDSSDVVHIAWYGSGWGTNPTINNVQYRNRTASGWGTQEGVTDTASRQYYPTIAIGSDDVIHTLWWGQGWGANPTKYNIQYRNRTASGWGTQEGVTDSASSQYYATIAIDSGGVIHTIWYGTGWGTNPTIFNVRYCNRTASGWGTQEGVTDSASRQYYPSITVDSSDMVHIVWHGQGWGTNPTRNNVQYRNRTASGWGTQEGITDGTLSQSYPGTMFAMHPIVSGSSTNIMDAGAGFVWTNTTGTDSVWYNRRGVPLPGETDSYNVSVNLTWHNATTNTFWNNVGLSPHGWSNITVYAWNASGNGNLSAGDVSQDTQIPNNPITIINTSDWYGNINETVYVDYDSTDADSDTPEYTCSRLDLFTDFNTTTGTGNWTPTANGTYYVAFGVYDGWGSSSHYVMTIRVGVAPPTTKTNIPMALFIALTILLFCSIGYIFYAKTHVSRIFTTLIATWLAFMLSQMIVSRNVVHITSALNTTDVWSHDTVAIQIPELSYLLLFIGVILSIFLVKFVTMFGLEVLREAQREKM